MQRVVDSIRDGTWLTRERLTTWCALLIAGYICMIAWLLLGGDGIRDALGRPIGTDFANIWSSGQLVLQGRPQAAFDPAIQRPFQQHLLALSPGLFYGWHYPPMFLGVAALLATLPYLAALALWLAATGATYVLTIQRIVAVDRRDTNLILLLALAYPAVLANITHGHNGFLTAAVFGTGLMLLPTKPLHAGALLGLLAYKPQYGLLIPLALACTGQGRAMASAAATVAATVVASIALFGWTSWEAFFTHASYTKETILENGAAGWFKLQGLFPAIRMAGGDLATAYAAQVILILLLAASIIWLWRARTTHEVKSAGLILATMLATPYAFNYDCVLLGAAIAFLAADGLQRGFARYEISALALLWITPLISREATALLHVPLALLVQALVFAMLLARVRRETTSSPRLAHAV